MNHPVLRLLLFIILLVVMFAAELTAPVQAGFVQPFTALIAQVSAWLVQTFDSTVVAEGIVLSNAETGMGVRIEAGCNGIEAMIVLTAAILAFPAPWKHKLAGLLVGFLAIQALNLVRIISLFYLLQWNQTWFEWAHLYLWQALIILDAMIVFILWLRLLPPPAEAHA